MTRMLLLLCAGFFAGTLATAQPLYDVGPERQNDRAENQTMLLADGNTLQEEVLLTEAELLLSPMPVVDQLHIEVPGMEETTYFSIYTTEGECLVSYIIEQQRSLRLNLPAGLYQYDLRDAEGVILKVGQLLLVQYL